MKERNKPFRLTMKLLIHTNWKCCEAIYKQKAI